MRRIISVVVVFTVLWIGYLVWPFYDLRQFAKAVEAGDVAEVSRRVDLPRLREALMQQLVDSYVVQSKPAAGSLRRSAAVAIVEPAAAKFMTADALTELLRVGWPRTILAERPPEAVDISVAQLGNAWALFAGSDYWFDRFDVNVPPSVPEDKAFGLRFRLTHWHWRLTSIRLPAHIRVLLADEVVKTRKAQASP